MNVPEGWKIVDGETVTDQEEVRGEALTIPVPVGYDDTGYLLHVGDATIIVSDSTARRLRKLLRPHGITRHQADRLALALDPAMGRQREEGRVAFMEKVFEGDLEGAFEGGQRSVDSRFALTDIDTWWEIGSGGVPMLLDEWLVEGELHWMYSEPEVGKTWVGLMLAREVIKRDGRVLWIDEELGSGVFVERMKTAGMSPEDASERFGHIEFPGFGRVTPDDKYAWKEILRRAGPDLVVIDTATDALTEAGVDENRGDEVTAWVKDFAEPARQRGAAVLVLDHVPKSSEARKDYAVGSRAKRAKAKVQYQLKADVPFRDRRKTGRIKVICTKDTRAASIPEERHYDIGGDPFVFSKVSALETAKSEASREGSRDRIKREIEGFLRLHEGKELSQNQIANAIKGRRSVVIDCLKEAATSNLWRVAGEPKGRTTVYRHAPLEDGS